MTLAFRILDRFLRPAAKRSGIEAGGGGRRWQGAPMLGSPQQSALAARGAAKARAAGLYINTPFGNAGPRVDGYEIRTAAVQASVPCVTTVQGASAAVQGIEAALRGGIGVKSLQDMHAAVPDSLDIRLDRFGAYQRSDEWVVVSGTGRLSLANETLSIHGKLAADAGYWQLADASTPQWV